MTDENKIKIMEEEGVEYLLTRYLYARDEVELSFVASLISGKDLEECYYWGYELYYSGYDVFRIIWKIYYDFYYEYNPGLETIIRNKESLWRQNKKIHYLAVVISNLVPAKASGRVFVMRQYIERVCSVAGNSERGFAGRGRRPAWCQDYDSKYRLLLLSIHRKLYREVAFHIYQLLHNCDVIAYGEELFIVILKYFAFARGCPCPVHEECLTAYEKLLTHNIFCIIPTYHWFIAIITCLMVGENYNNAPVYIHNNGILNKMRAIEEDTIPLNKYGSEQVYNTLKYKRYYGTIRFMLGFTLGRNGLGERLRDEALGRWQHYVWNTPCWRERLCKFGVDENIEFENDDILEEFYDRFGYEPDEQPIEIQQQSIGALEDDWYKTVFCEEPCIKFNDGVLFVY